MLIYKFSCKCSLHYQRDNPVIYISRRSVKNLTPELIKYIPKSIHYKILGKKKSRKKYVKIIQESRAGQTRENSFLSEYNVKRTIVELNRN